MNHSRLRRWGLGMVGILLAAGPLAQRATAQYVVPGPVVVRSPIGLATPPPVVVHQAPPRMVVQPQAPIVVQARFDPYQDALGRLQSRHDNSRRDGAVTLGRLRDPRAVPDLVWLLQNDRESEVRTAAAFALGAIGDPRAAHVLHAAALGDRNRRVRQAAAHAHGLLTYPPMTTTVTSIAEPPVVIESGPPTAVEVWPPIRSEPPLTPGLFAP